MFGAPNQFLASPKGDTFRPISIPAPIGGLNAYDSLVAMPETDAIVMQNWWPQPYGCSVRKGYVEWATGMPTTVETIAGWADVNGDRKLFAWSDGNMYDISSRAAVGAPIVVALSNSRWESVVLANAAGNHMISVNGADSGIIYRTAGVARITAGDGIVANTWAGLDPANAAQVIVHQKRLWAVQRDTTKGWYLPVNALQGTFVSFDFGPLFSKGGYLQVLATWTLDDESGANDRLVAISSEGEAAVYYGSDPNDDTKWALAGVYFLGAPVAGRRCLTKVAGDLMVLTTRGLVSMTAEVVANEAQQQEAPIESRKIQFLLNELVASYGTLNGWEVHHHPPINMTLLNIPSVVAGGNNQLAVNHIIKSWTQFTNMDSACWLSYGSQLYFGDYAGNVHQAWTGNSDRVLLDNTGGEGVTAAVQQAYTFFGNRGTSKQVGIYRPTFAGGVQFGYNCRILYNFQDGTVVVPTLVPTGTGSLWGTGLWGTALWSGGVSVTQNWVTAEGMGVAASLKMITLSNDEVLWVSTDYTVSQSSGVL